MKSNLNENNSQERKNKSNDKIKVTKKRKLKDLEIGKDLTPQEILNHGHFDYEQKLKYESLGKHKKTKSGVKEVYSQLANYTDKHNIDFKKNNKNNEYSEIKPIENKNCHRKAESKHEQYLEKLEENSAFGEIEEIKHSDLLNYIPEKLFFSIDKKDFEKLSPRSKEINQNITINRRSFKEHNHPPVTTTDFYKIGRMLGKGAFGKVNLGMHKLARKLVAIKSMNKDFLNDEKSKKKLMQEVAIIKRTRHPNVVKLYETFESAKHVLFSMEM